MASASHVLLVSVFYRRQKDGSRKRYRRGDVVDGLSDADVRRLAKAGAIGPQGVEGSTGTVLDGELTEVPAVATTPAAETATSGGSGDPRPPRVATKPVLVAWLVGRTGFDQAELESQSKDDLWALIDATD